MPPQPDAEPAPAAEAAARPLPESAPSSKQAPEPPPQPPPLPQAEPGPVLNLGGTDSPSNATVEDATNVTPASPDNRYRNRDPIYPPDAARRGQQGAVVLLIHVGVDGVPTSVEITQSSGVRSLDRAAQDAVLLWHFHAGLRDGKPVPSDFPLQIRFRIAQ